MQSVPQPQAPPLRPPSSVPDIIAIPATVLERFARVGLDVVTLLRRAEIPRSRFTAPKPEGTTAELSRSGAQRGDRGAPPNPLRI